jgi:hypothetical protein
MEDGALTMHGVKRNGHEGLTLITRIGGQFYLPLSP